jgi:hypothetical protein
LGARSATMASKPFQSGGIDPGAGQHLLVDEA